MRRYYAIVVIRGSDQDRRILRPCLDVVNRRVGIERFELGFVSVASSIVSGPVPADGEQVITQHVHDAGVLMHGAKQVWTLVRHCADQEAAIRSAFNSQLRRRSALLLDYGLSPGNQD